jgi:hypothetical protein
LQGVKENNRTLAFLGMNGTDSAQKNNTEIEIYPSVTRDFPVFNLVFNSGNAAARWIRE